MSTPKIKEVLLSVSNEEYILPNFQREYTYDRSKQRALIASVLTFIPIGTIMTLKGSPGLMSYRNIGRRSGADVEEIDQPFVHFVLDGQQRLTTLWACFNDVFDGLSLDERNELREKLSPKLLNRWNLHIVPDETEEDIFGWRSMELDVTKLRKRSPEDFEDCIRCDQSLEENDIWPWGDGTSIVLPELITNNPDDLRRRREIESKGIIPLHKIFDSQPFVRAIGRFRINEFTNMLDSIYDSKEHFAQCTSDEVDFMNRVLGVSRDVEFDVFRDARYRLDALEDRLGRWTESLNRYFYEVSEQLIFNVELAQTDFGKASVIFDVINQTGERLTVFDLFCARHPDFNVRMILQDALDEFPESLGLLTRDRVPEKKFLDLFMNTLRALHHANQVTGSPWKFAQAIKEDVLSIDSVFVQENLLLCVKAVANAVSFAQNKLGIRRLSETPYLLQLVPIGMGFALYDNEPSNEDLAYLEYVYWFSMFSGRYREAQNKTVGDDITHVVERIRLGISLNETYRMSGPWGVKILEYDGYNNKTHLIENDKEEPVGESVRKSIVQFILAQQPVDFPNSSQESAGRRLNASIENLELHHIIPLASQSTVNSSAKALKKEKGPINSPLNLTFISKESNRFLGPLPLATYINNVDPSALVGHCLHAGKIVPYNVNDPAQLRNWLEGRFDAIKMTIQTKLNMLSNQL
jgi:hypothetical protein